MDASKISSRKFTKHITRKNSTRRNSGTSTDSLTIWLLTASRVREDSSGLARTTMEMSSQTLSLRDTVHSVS